MKVSFNGAKIFTTKSDDVILHWNENQRNDKYTLIGTKLEAKKHESEPVKPSEAEIYIHKMAGFKNPEEPVVFVDTKLEAEVIILTGQEKFIYDSFLRNVQSDDDRLNKFNKAIVFDKVKADHSFQEMINLRKVFENMFDSPAIKEIGKFRKDFLNYLSRNAKTTEVESVEEFNKIM